MSWGQLGGRREESSLTSASCFAGLAAGLYLGLETIVVSCCSCCCSSVAFGS